MEREQEAELIKQHKQLVAKVAYSRFRSRASDPDLLQEGLIGLWEAVQRWRGEGVFEAYAWKCIYHRMLDHVRKQSRHPTPEELHEWLPDERDCFFYDGLSELLQRINDVWPKGSTERFVLRELALGASKKELAAQMGKDTYSITQTAKKAIRRVLDEENNDCN